MNILIVRLSAIGDVIHTLAAVAPLRRHFPGCTITWVAEETAAELIKGYPGIDRLIVSRRKQWLKDLKKLRWTHAAVETGQFLGQLRQDSYDLILDFQGLFKSGILVFFARGRRKLGYANAREASTLFYTEKAPAPDFNEHAIKRHMALIHFLGVGESSPDFAPLYSRSDETSIEKLFDSEHIDRHKPVVAFHPSAMWKTKQWPRERVAGLCDMLQEQCNCQVLFVGGAEEKKYLGQICALVRGKAVNLAGRTSLKELACLISKAALLLSMDSGPMHISCAVGTPAVGLFGPTATWRTGPFGENDRIIRKQLSCSPCFKKAKCPEGHHRCMQNITVEEVFKICCNYLENREYPAKA